MSSLAISSPYSLSVRSENTGTSDASVQLARQYSEARLRSVTSSPVMRQAVLDLLIEIFEECQVDGWDGYSARSISETVYLSAVSFLTILPQSMPLPNDIVPESDGEIAFEWRNGPRRVYSVSVGSSGTLSYAGLFGAQAKTHGTEIFDDAIPQTVLGNIRRVFHS